MVRSLAVISPFNSGAPAPHREVPRLHGRARREGRAARGHAAGQRGARRGARGPPGLAKDTNE